MAFKDWTKDEHAAWRSQALAVHRKRSQRNWMLDLSRIAGFGTLEVSSAWTLTCGDL